MRRFALVLLASAAWAAQPATLELRVEVEPPLRRGVASVSAVGTPFRKETRIFQGKFKFKNLQPGAYTVTVFHPRWGPSQRTVSVTPSFADSKHRVEFRFEIARSREKRSQALEESSTVSLRELSVSPEAQEEFRKGRRRLEKRDVSAAVEHFLEAVEISPQFAVAWNELGTIAFQSGNYEQAEEYFRAALEQDSDSFPPTVNLGGALLAQQRYEEALHYNLYALELEPGDPLANAQTGINYLRLEDLEEAVKFLKRAKQADPAHFTLPQLYLAEIYQRTGKLSDAAAELESLIEQHPDSAEAESARGRLQQL